MKIWFSLVPLLVTLLGANANAQTNIIQIVADDMGWTDLSGGTTNLGNGSEYYQTPNLEAMAAAGMSFSSAYVQQSCVPTRAALMTGQYAARTEVFNVGALNGIGDTTLLDVPNNNTSLANGATTIAEALSAVGYVTAHVGKFHVTGNPNQIIAQHGFQINIGGTGSGAPNGTVPYFAEQNQQGVWQFGTAHGPELDLYAAPYSQQYINANLLPFANGNDPQVLLNSPKHLNDAMADATIDFLADRSADGNPFFINVAFNAVHNEINSRMDLETKYDSLNGTPTHSLADYAGVLEGMDQAIGRIMQFVQSGNLADDTLIVFISDNGSTENNSGSFPLSGGKGDFVDGGIRAPMIAYQPGVVPAGAISDEAVHAIDFYQTFIELAGAQPPAVGVHPLDGESLAEIFTGQSSELDRQNIYYHFPGYIQNEATPLTFAIHDAADGNRYKMFYFYEDRSFEMYNLTSDISESNELFAAGMTSSQFAIAICLTNQMKDWLTEIDAPLPTVRATGNTVPSIGHSPTIRFDFSPAGFGSQLDNQNETTLQQLGVEMTCEAAGQNAFFDVGNSGVGVNSGLDAGGQNLQRRIDGTLAVAESFVVSFNRDVVVKSVNTSQFSGDGTESAVISLLSGTNPFSNLSGYDSGGFSLQNESLVFARTDGANNNAFDIRLGALDQDEILLVAGTRVSITTNPATQGGFVLESIDIAIPNLRFGDMNQDGNVNLLDVSPFIQAIASGGYVVEADTNKDGNVNLLDVATFIQLLSAG